MSSIRVDCSRQASRQTRTNRRRAAESNGRPSKRGSLALAGLVCLLSFPLALGAVPMDSQERATRRQHIAAMSSTERARLERNLHTFLQLSRDQRARYVELHQFIASDAHRNDVLHAYLDWLKTLSPWQRDELRNTANPKERMQRVREFLEEQQQASDQDDRLFPATGPFSKSLARPTAKDSSAMIQILEESLDVPLRDRRVLESLDGFERHLMVVELAIRQLLNIPRARRPEWLEPQLCDKMIDAIASEPLRNVLRRRLTPEQQRRAVMGVVLQGLFNEWKAEVQKHQPDERALKEFFMNLPGEPRDEIMRLPPKEARERLVDQYNATYQTHLNDLGERIRRMRGRVSGFWRPSSVPPFFKRNPTESPFQRERSTRGSGPDRPGTPRRLPARPPNRSNLNSQHRPFGMPHGLGFF